MIEIIINKNTYFFNELNDAKFKNTFADDRLKKFHVKKNNFIIQFSNNRIEKLNDDAIDDDDDFSLSFDVTMNRDEDLILSD